MIHRETTACELLKLFMRVSGSAWGDCRRHFLTHVDCLDDCREFFDALQFRVPYPVHVFELVLQQLERKLHDHPVVRDIQLSDWPERASLQQRLCCLIRLVSAQGCGILGLLCGLIIISVIEVVLMVYQNIIFGFSKCSESIFRGDLACPGRLKVAAHSLRGVIPLILIDDHPLLR